MNDELSDTERFFWEVLDVCWRLRGPGAKIREQIIRGEASPNEQEYAFGALADGITRHLSHLKDSSLELWLGQFFDKMYALDSERLFARSNVSSAEFVAVRALHVALGREHFERTLRAPEEAPVLTPSDAVLTGLSEANRSGHLAWQMPPMATGTNASNWPSLRSSSRLAGHAVRLRATLAHEASKFGFRDDQIRVGVEGDGIEIVCRDIVSLEEAALFGKLLKAASQDLREYETRATR